MYNFVHSYFPLFVHSYSIINTYSLSNKKEESYKDLEMIFHSDQGSVYS